MARFRHRRFNAPGIIRSEKDFALFALWLVLGIEGLMKSGMVRPENDSVLLPMARFGIESIAKKDGYPSQNDFALSPKGTD